MKTFKFIPKCCRGEDATHEGFVELNGLDIEEKFDLLAEQGIAPDAGDDGLMRVNTTKDPMAFLRRCMAVAKDKYVTVEIKEKATGCELKSYDDLRYDPGAGHNIITEIAGAMVGGYKVGND